MSITSRIYETTLHLFGMMVKKKKKERKVCLNLIILLKPLGNHLILFLLISLMNGKKLVFIWEWVYSRTYLCKLDFTLIVYLTLSLSPFWYQQGILFGGKNNNNNKIGFNTFLVCLFVFRFYPLPLLLLSIFNIWHILEGFWPAGGRGVGRWEDHFRKL